MSGMYNVLAEANKLIDEQQDIIYSLRAEAAAGEPTPDCIPSVYVLRLAQISKRLEHLVAISD
jgi:hypothetical protein